MATSVCVLLKEVINLFFERTINKNKIDWIKCKEDTYRNFTEI